jgi:hypothetical protein
MAPTVQQLQKLAVSKLAHQTSVGVTRDANAFAKRKPNADPLGQFSMTIHAHGFLPKKLKSFSIFLNSISIYFLFKIFLFCSQFNFA